MPREPRKHAVHLGRATNEGVAVVDGDDDGVGVSGVRVGVVDAACHTGSAADVDVLGLRLADTAGGGTVDVVPDVDVPASTTRVDVDVEGDMVQMSLQQLAVSSPHQTA